MPGVYISWPFCSQKCTYCNFASGLARPATEAAYLEALCGELRSCPWAWNPDTVYFGGGTPSLLSPDQLARILDLVPGAPWAELTVEAAPGSLSVELLREWKRLGVNRVSLGVQSFVDKELRQTGRRHNAETVAADCEILRAAGIPNYNLDLIAGLPFQTPESWEESLAWIHRLRPPHVSVYMLEVDEDSRLGLEIIGEGARYGAAAVPSDDVIVANYEFAVAALAEMGIQRYEISNFSVRGAESRHNLKYWRMEPYRGFGVDAHSCDAGFRWGNPDDLDDYITRATQAQPLDEAREPVRPLEEQFLTGLRLDEGLEVDGSALPDALSERIQARVRDGLLRWNGPRLSFTPKGVLFSNEVFEDFLGIDFYPRSFPAVAKTH